MDERKEDNEREGVGLLRHLKEWSRALIQIDPIRQHGHKGFQITCSSQVLTKITSNRG